MSAPERAGQHVEHGLSAGQEPRHATNRDLLASRLVVEQWAVQADQARNARLAARLRRL